MSLLSILLAAINAKTTIPNADPFWSDFNCFSDGEANEYRKEFGIDTNRLAINSMLKVIGNTWSFQSYVASILLQDILSINVDLVDWKDDAEAKQAIVDNSDDLDLSYILHWDILEESRSHIPELSETEAASACQTLWSIRKDVVQAVEAEIGTSSSNMLYLDLWISFLHPSVIEAMDSANDVIIPPNENGNFGCSQEDGCDHGDSTWYPPQCDPSTNAHHDCTVLLQFLPEYDSVARDLIVERELPIVIKYMGSERTKYGQNNFQRFYDERWKVIFQLRTTQTQSNDLMGWSSVALPVDQGVDLNIDTKIWKLRSADTGSRSWEINGLVQAMNLQPTHLAEMQRLLISSDDVSDGSRMRTACNWLRSESNGHIWKSWFRVMDSRSVPVCHTIGDDELQFLDSFTYAELWRDFDDIRKRIPQMLDSWSALYAKEVCILATKDGKNDALYQFGYGLSGFTVFVLATMIVSTFMRRRETVVTAVSLNMVTLMYLGATLTLSYSLFLRVDVVSHCVLRRYIEQIAAVLVFATLEVKMRGFRVIYHQTTDQKSFLKVITLTMFVFVYLSVLILVCPVEIETNITDRMWQSKCMWNERATNVYLALVLVEILALLMFRHQSFQLWTKNEDCYEVCFFYISSIIVQRNCVFHLLQPNLVGAAMYGAAAIVGGCLVRSQMPEITVNRTMTQSILITTLILAVLLMLMAPKFPQTMNEIAVAPDVFQVDSMSSRSYITNEETAKLRSVSTSLLNLRIFCIKKTSLCCLLSLYMAHLRGNGYRIFQRSEYMLMEWILLEEDDQINGHPSPSLEL